MFPQTPLLISILPEPVIDWLLIVLIFVPETSSSCLLSNASFKSVWLLKVPWIFPQETLLPSAPLGIPKVNDNSLAVLGPEADTVAVAKLPAGNVCAVANIEPKPASIPVSPWLPWGP